MLAADSAEVAGGMHINHVPCPLTDHTGNQMGKANFSEIVADAKRANGGILTAKISYFSDHFRKDSNFAGLIIYRNKGQHRWTHTAGEAQGQNARSFYVFIQDTGRWPAGAVHDRVGQGAIRCHGAV